MRLILCKPRELCSRLESNLGWNGNNSAGLRTAQLSGEFSSLSSCISTRPVVCSLRDHCRIHNDRRRYATNSCCILSAIRTILKRNLHRTMSFRQMLSTGRPAFAAARRCLSDVARARQVWVSYGRVGRPTSDNSCRRETRSRLAKRSFTRCTLGRVLWL